MLRSKNPRLGCGTGYFFRTKEKTLLDACILRDIHYDKGGPAISRSQSDKVFLKNMLVLAEGKWKHIVRSYLYFTLVSLFGFLFFKKRSTLSASLIKTEGERVSMRFIGNGKDVRA